MTSVDAAVASPQNRAFVNFSTLVNRSTLAQETCTRELEVVEDRGGRAHVPEHFTGHKGGGR